MAKEQTKNKVVLKGEKALALWRQGKDKWNIWVNENPVADVDFSGVDFAKDRSGDMSVISFNGFNFPKGNVYFREAKFGEGNVEFSHAQFGEGRYSFEQTIFKGHASFSHIKNISRVASLSFKSASFEKTLDLSGNRLNCIIDLTQTKTNHHVSLHGLHCDLPKETIEKGFFNCNFDFNKARDSSDIDKLRRLKELATANEDPQRALVFHADEMRAKRWHENTGIKAWLDLLYDKLSNYGRSVLWPFIWLINLWLLFGYYYYLASGNIWISATKRFFEALAFSGSQILPIIASSRVARLEGIKILYFNDLTPILHLVTTIQSLLSFGLLFLIGLALRNRFRI